MGSLSSVFQQSFCIKNSFLLLKDFIKFFVLIIILSISNHAYAKGRQGRSMTSHIDKCVIESYKKNLCVIDCLNRYIESHSLNYLSKFDNTLIQYVENLPSPEKLLAMTLINCNINAQKKEEKEEKKHTEQVVVDRPLHIDIGKEIRSFMRQYYNTSEIRKDTDDFGSYLSYVPNHLRLLREINKLSTNRQN